MKWLRRLICRLRGHESERWETTYCRVNRKRPKRYPANRLYYKCGRCGTRLKGE